MTRNNNHSIIVIKVIAKQIKLSGIANTPVVSNFSLENQGLYCISQPTVLLYCTVPYCTEYYISQPRVTVSDEDVSSFVHFLSTHLLIH